MYYLINVELIYNLFKNQINVESNFSAEILLWRIYQVQTDLSFLLFFLNTPNVSSPLVITAFLFYVHYFGCLHLC